MANATVYRANQEMPAFAVSWADRAGVLIDFSNPNYTFAARLVDRTGGVVLHKTFGLIGAATSPNLIVVWDDGELDITPGDYRLHITASYPGSGDRMFLPGAEPVIRILAAVTGDPTALIFDGGSPGSTYGDDDFIDGGTP